MKKKISRIIVFSRLCSSFSNAVTISIIRSVIELESGKQFKKFVTFSEQLMGRTLLFEFFSSKCSE